MERLPIPVGCPHSPWHTQPEQEAKSPNHPCAQRVDPRNQAGSQESEVPLSKAMEALAYFQDSSLLESGARVSHCLHRTVSLFPYKAWA